MITKRSCRICLINKGTISIFAKTNYVVECIADTIVSCTKLKITPNDGFLDSICNNCAKNVAIILQFKIESIDSDKKMRKFFEEESIIDEIKTEPFALYLNDEEPKDWDKGIIKMDLKSEVDTNMEPKENLFITSSLPVAESVETNSRPYKCNVCNKGYFSRSGLARHFGIKHKALKCLKCGKIFTDENELNNHTKTHKSDTLDCDECSKSFKSQKILQHHYQKEHFKVQKRVCEICGRDFPTVYALKRHHTNIHDESKPYYTCDICPKKFAAKSILVGHRRKHFGDKPYQCSYCVKSFSCHSSFNSHLQYHTGKFRHTCTFCKKGFTSPSNLKVHLRIHTGERPYECDQCNKTFNHSGIYKNHMQLHSGEKQLACKVCGKQFMFKTGLTRHEIIHTGLKPFKCKLCEFRCNISMNLKTHMKIHLKRK